MKQGGSQKPEAAGRTESQGHRGQSEPSPWVARFAPLAPEGAGALDLACGRGRHSRLLLDLGHRVLAVDRDISGLGDLGGHPRLEAVQCDLESGDPPRFLKQRFGAIVVTNYLHRPLLPAIRAAVAPGGILIYETFAEGNARFGKPSNPDFLLRPGELLDWLGGALRVLAYEDLVVDTPRRAAVQRICAQRV